MKAMLVLLAALVFLMACGDSNPAAPNEPPAASTLSTVIDFALVQLSWTQCGNDDFAAYRLYRSTVAGISSNPGTPLTTFTDPTDLSYNDATVEQDQDYYFAIETIDSGDLSSWSNEAYVHTPVEAVAGGWAGTTDQGKPITFLVTTNQEIGNIYVEIDIAWAPDIWWEFSEYWAYETDGTWTASGIVTWGGHTHEIELEGTFDASNVCTGSLTAWSETYYSGYYEEAEFTVNPE